RLIKKQQKCTDAQPPLKRVAKHKEQALGSNHAETIETIFSLAFCYFEMGKYSIAKRLYEQIIDIREREFGPDHLNLAISLNNLGMIEYRLGEFVRAKQL